MELFARRNHRSAWLVAAAALILAHGAWREASMTATEGRAQPVQSNPARVRLMQAHFSDALAVEAAVIRGDLADVAAPATALAEHDTPRGIGKTGAMFLSRMREAARHAAEATTLAAAAREAAVMLVACGDCHRAVGAQPALVSPTTGATSVVVERMGDHQRAANLMLQGLIVPSTTLWEEGARALQGARLRRAGPSRNNESTPGIKIAEERLRRAASDAVFLRESFARAAAYAELLVSCAECHSLYREISAPSRR